MSEQRETLVVGCGGIGGLVAAALLQARWPLSIVARATQLRETLAQQGLAVHGVALPPRVTIAADALHAGLPKTPTVGLLILATQGGDVEAVVREALPLIDHETRVLCLQNGLAEPRVADVLRRAGCAAPVCGAVISWGAATTAVGTFAQTARGATTLGRLDGADDPLLDELAQALRSLGSARLTTNLLGARWSKLAINCATTALGVVSGELLGATLARAHCRQLALEVIAEVVAVARAEGVELERVAGTLDLDWLTRDLQTRRGRWLRHVVMLAVGLRYRRLRSSMLAAIERGREPAIDHLNGEVVRRGRRLGVDVSRNAALVELVWRIARGEVRPSPRHLCELYESTKR